ncbi:MAG: glycosyltransferase family 4 protein [Thermochromatium sp.]
MSSDTRICDQSPGDRLKIALVTETYPPEINGVANTMRQLVKGMEARGHAVQLIRPRQPADPRYPEQSNRLELYLVPGLPIPGYRGLRFGLPVYWRLRRLWHRRRVDLVYIATQGPLGHAALSAAQALKIPTVTGFHTHFQHYSRHYGLGVLTHQIARTLKQFHNRSDATLVPTAELRDTLAAEGFENLYIFGRGVDVDQFTPDRRSPELRRAWGCTEDDLVVLYVGRIAAEKNLTLALAGFRAIQRQYPSVRFVLVGDGPERPHLQQEHPDLIFAGAQIGDELAAHYASGDLFLFPSLTETFGNVITEAMASGLPVIAFDYAAARAHIQSWVNGVTIPVDAQESFIDICLECVSDRERLRRMGLEARRRALDIGWERILGRFEEHLFAVIHRKRGQAESCHANLATTSK